MSPNFAFTVAGAVVALAFFALIGYVVTVLRATTRPAAVITSIAALAAALPAILYALYGLR
jgi:hypothetical protein